jgi:hypothetical protein
LGPSRPTELPTQLGQLRLTLEAPASARSGRPVPLVFSVLNPGNPSVTLQLLGREPTADFRISDSQDRVVWSRLRGQTMLGALRLYQLGAGKRLRWSHTWDQRTDGGTFAPPGEYLVRGVLLTDVPGGLASPPFRLRITP